MKILTAQQMREVDRITIEKLGVPGPLLMENAGRNVFEVLREKFPALAQERITILCGKGNNGGDGFVVARHLYQRGIAPRVILLAEPQSLKGDARLHYDILLQAGLQPLVARDWNEWSALRPEIGMSTLLVDAMLGTGLTGPAEDFYGQVIGDINNHFTAIPIMAVDMPSGLPSDTGEVLGESLRACCTVTFTAPKWSHIFPPNCERVGQLFVTSIGTPSSLYEDNPSIFLNLVEARDVAAFVGKRQSDSHKGTYGHVLVVAGSVGKSGAAALASLGALRAGAGLVTAAVPSSILPLVAGAAPTLMTEPLAETDAGTISPRAFDYGRFAAIAKGKTVIALGPGLSTHPETVQFVRKLLADFAQFPVVIDADALTAFSDSPELRGEGRTLILTPHPGEMARLTGLTTKEIQASRVEIAREFAMRQKVDLVLKGYRTLVAEPGGQVFVNPTGNPGMATAGVGDVLTGMIAGLLAQHTSAPVEKVVSAAVYWHGAAGNCVASHKGELPLLATDLLEALPQALVDALPEALAAEASPGGGCC